MDNSILLNETEINPFRKSTLNEKKSQTSQSQSVKKSRPCKILALGLYNFDRIRRPFTSLDTYYQNFKMFTLSQEHHLNRMLHVTKF